MKKIINVITVGLMCFLLVGCGAVKLTNGENAVVSFKDDEGISTNELYEILKDKYGADELITLIDTYLLEKEYDTTTEETKYIDEVIETIESEAEKAKYDFETYISYYYGISTKDAFKDYIKLNYRRMLWAQDYLESEVTDKQINEYYESKTIGDIDAKHILISADITDDMTDEKKKEAETKAYELAKSIIKKLDNGEDFEALAKEYSDDSSSAEKGGNLGKFNRGDMTKEFENAAIELKVGTYSSTPVKTTYGYHIIYKISQEDKPELDSVKDEIITTIAKETLESDSTLYASSLIELRNKYEMNIKDSELQTSYTKVIYGNQSKKN